MGNAEAKFADDIVIPKILAVHSVQVAQVLHYEITDIILKLKIVRLNTTGDANVIVLRNPLHLM